MFVRGAIKLGTLTVTQKILSDKILKQDNDIMLAAHNLHQTALFSDEKLAEAIENHPAELLDICLKGSFIQVDRNGASGRDVLECVKQGLLWINLRRIETVDSPIGRLIKQMHLESHRTLGRKTYNHVGGLLISSPRSGAGYHFDLTDVTLWHIRGDKRIYIYPVEEPFLSKDGLEKIVLGRGVEKVPYDPGFDAAAKIFDLKPGQMISWPHLAPHRVENGDMLNVSLSLEAVSLASRLRLGSHFFDAYTKKHFGRQIFGHSSNSIIKFVKTGISTIIKKLGASEQDKEFTGYSYRLKPQSQGFLDPVGQIDFAQAAE